MCGRVAAMMLCTSWPLAAADEMAATQSGIVAPRGDSAGLSTASLMTQEGTRLAPGYFDHGYTVMAFFYSRCEAPESCTVIMSKFQKIESLVADDPGLDGRVQLLAVTVDPTHDTPEVLRRYATDLGTDLKRWTFVTGEESSVADFVREFGARIREGSTPEHRHVTVLLAPKGKVMRMYEGADWDPLAVLQLINAQAR